MLQDENPLWVKWKCNGPNLWDFRYCTGMVTVSSPADPPKLNCQGDTQRRLSVHIRGIEGGVSGQRSRLPLLRQENGPGRSTRCALPREFHDQGPILMLQDE